MFMFIILNSLFYPLFVTSIIYYARNLLLFILQDGQLPFLIQRGSHENVAVNI